MTRSMMNSAMQVLSAVAAVGWVMLSGCAGGGVISTHLENRLVANGIADDHIAAALLYQQKANQLESDAARLEQQGKRIGLHEDPKGFRRDAFRTTAQTRRQEASEMERLYAAHFGKADGDATAAVSHSSLKSPDQGRRPTMALANARSTDRAGAPM